MIIYVWTAVNQAKSLSLPPGTNLNVRHVEAPK